MNVFNVFYRCTLILVSDFVCTITIFNFNVTLFLSKLFLANVLKLPLFILVVLVIEKSKYSTHWKFLNSGKNKIIFENIYVNFSYHFSFHTSELHTRSELKFSIMYLVSYKNKQSIALEWNSKLSFYVY